MPYHFGNEFFQTTVSLKDFEDALEYNIDWDLTASNDNVVIYDGDNEGTRYELTMAYENDTVTISYDGYSWEIKPLNERIELPNETGIQPIDIQDITMDYLMNVGSQLLFMDLTLPSDSEEDTDDYSLPDKSAALSHDDEGTEVTDDNNISQNNDRKTFNSPHTTSANVNLRTEPNTESEIITVVAEGSVVYRVELYSSD